ncbi:MAG: cell division protein FtsZ [Candidatus Lambdaproteobacteria bacterium]|nr:cell division protein FtsZ [Candidatus Lambdaproteobacteria bacterium]
MGIDNIKEAQSPTPVLKVVGVGGGGGNAVNRMVSCGIRAVEFYVANTDVQDLSASLAPHRVQLGTLCTRGLGAGAKPEIGREAALEDIDAVRASLAGADMVFITAGLGGGTGTGAAPVIAEVARELGCLTVGVVTKPFKFEGRVRARNGDQGILQLRKHVDTLIVIPNDNLLLLANRKTTIQEAFGLADDVLRVAIQGISDLINEQGLINVDFADVRTIMANMGHAIMGTGVASGENRAIEAAEKAISCPLLDNCKIDGAKGILINVTGPANVGMYEVNEAARYITDHADEDANIIFGAAIDESMQDELEVTVIATGFGDPETEEAAPKESEESARFRPSYNVYSSEPRAERKPPKLHAMPSKSFKPEPPEHRADINEMDVPSVDFSADTDPLNEENVFELDNPILEQVETEPQIPQSYRPVEKPATAREGGIRSDLDIPPFIRKRSQRFADE